MRSKTTPAVRRTVVATHGCAHRPTSRRRGSVYILVLGSAMIVMVIGLAAVTGVQLERQSAQSDADFARARLYARSAIEMGYFWMNDDPSWRTTHAASTIWATAQPIGDGAFTLTVDDPDDGKIDSAPNNKVVMTGTGICNDAKFLLEVTLSVDATTGGLIEIPGSWKRVVQ